MQTVTEHCYVAFHYGLLVKNWAKKGKLAPLKMHLHFFEYLVKLMNGPNAGPVLYSSMVFVAWCSALFKAFMFCVKSVDSNNWFGLSEQQQYGNYFFQHTVRIIPYSYSYSEVAYDSLSNVDVTSWEFLFGMFQAVSGLLLICVQFKFLKDCREGAYTRDWEMANGLRCTGKKQSWSSLLSLFLENLVDNAVFGPLHAFCYAIVPHFMAIFGLMKNGPVFDYVCGAKPAFKGEEAGLTPVDLEKEQ